MGRAIFFSKPVNSEVAGALITGTPSVVRTARLSFMTFDTADPGSIAKLASLVRFQAQRAYPGDNLMAESTFD